jgi:hypothetical protein
MDEEGSASTVNVISQGYILMEKRNRVSNVMMVENNISAMIEGSFVIREMILSMVARKYK